MKKTDNYIPIAISLFFLALISPLLLIPLEKLIPYPYIVEELVKGVFVLLILCLPSKNFQIKLAVFIAFLFSFSENFFYLSNFIIDRNISSFFERFIFASLLHAITILIILLPSQKNSRLFFPAIFIAMLFHFLYNYMIPIFF
jgi:hypothetical protein